jgi:hypothetical protein
MRRSVADVPRPTGVTTTRSLRRAPRLAALVTGLAAGALTLTLVALAVWADTGDGRRTTPVPPATTSPSVGDSTPGPTRLDPITLEASQDDGAVLWDEVAVVPAGDAEEEVGVEPCSDCGDRLVPTALAVGPDRTFWVADRYKRRIAHFAEDGSFLGATPVDSGPADLAFVGDRLYVLLADDGSEIAVAEGGVLRGPITVNDDGRPLHVEALIGGQGELLVLIQGAERLLGGYWAYASVDPATGQVMPSAGVLTHFGTRADLQPSRPATFDLRWSLGDRPTAVQGIGFQLVRDGSNVETTVGDAYLRTCTGGGVATVMSIGDGAGTPVGAWYLEISAQGRAPIFERLPADGFIEDIRRSLTFGPDGVYWMQLRDDGLHIYRR